MALKTIVAVAAATALGSAVPASASDQSLNCADAYVKNVAELCTNKTESQLSNCRTRWGRVRDACVQRAKETAERLRLRGTNPPIYNPK